MKTILSPLCLPISPSGRLQFETYLTAAHNTGPMEGRIRCSGKKQSAWHGSGPDNTQIFVPFAAMERDLLSIDSAADKGILRASRMDAVVTHRRVACECGQSAPKEATTFRSEYTARYISRFRRMLSTYSRVSV
jgi:hypothetical protein